MNGEAILTVGAAVVALTQMAKWAMQGKGDAWGPLIVFALSALGVGLWGFSQDTFVRTDTWAYFAGWIAVALSASGVYGFKTAHHSKHRYRAKWTRPGGATITGPPIRAY